MRLPFPERLPLFPVGVFCTALLLLQQLQGTSLIFSTCSVAFIILATLAFNLTGGLTRPSGGFIFSYAVFGVIFGITWKVLVNEAGQTNLQQPELTIEVYVVSVAAMLGAAYLAKRLRLKKNYLPHFRSLPEMRRSSTACLVLGGGATILLMLRGGGDSAGPRGVFETLGPLLGAFLALAIFIGVTYEIRQSSGRSSVNAIVLIGVTLVFIEGVLGYSKEGMFTPFICWLLPAATHRYRISLLQIAVIAMGLGFTVVYLVPYSQYGRGFKNPTATFEENLSTNLLLLSNLERVRQIYNAAEAEAYVNATFFRYYNHPQGIADRVQMITPDDALIDATQNGAAFGVFPTLFSFENLIPHFLWKNKPSIGFGNIYAREIGILPPDDIDTQISFSPSGDAFHQARWIGITTILPVLCFLLFLSVDSFCGDTRASPFALIPLLTFFHAAPEGGLEQFATAMFTGVIYVYITAFIATRVMPFAAELLLGRQRMVALPEDRFSADPSRGVAPLVESADGGAP